ncbi:MAG: hypothetical protein LRY68_07870 [Sulfurospirillum sp.]|nr:hypothetical protein [Sulfurospirillum sp.]
MQELISRLQIARRELNHNRVSWIDKHLVIDLNQKATVLINSLIRFENEPQQKEVINAANEFLIEVEPIIQHLNNQTGELK